MSSESIIDVKGLKKSFKSRRSKRGGTVDAVKGIDLAVREGECFGFLGPNGAGKSTTLRMLATLLAPDGGDAVIAGHDLLKEPVLVRRQIGYVSQAGGSDRAATGREDLMLQAGLYGLSAAQAASRIEELSRALELGEFLDRFSQTYSGGQRRKLDIALGMVHAPKVLFLDEPTTGLDPVSRVAILLGFIIRDLAVLLVQSTLLVLMAIPLGLTVNLGGLLVTFVMLMLTGILMASCSYALALLLKQENTLASVTNTVSTPLLLLSGITLPLALAPQVIRSIASVNPFAYEVTAARALFLGDFAESAILTAVLLLAGLGALSFVWAVRSFKRGTA